MKGKIRGGIAAGCTGCSWMTVGGSVPSLIKAHYEHHQGQEAAAPTVSAVSLGEQLAQLDSRLTAVTDG